MKPFILALALFFLMVGGALAQVAPVPSLMNFQGRLAKPDGTPVTDGNHTVVFTLFDAQTGGTVKWTESLNITSRNGVFSVLLGSVTALNETVFAADRWLEVKVDGATLTPRQKIVSNAFAFKANLANTVPNGSLTAAKFQGGVLTPGGTAGGDLTGGYPNPLLATLFSSLTKVSGGSLTAISNGSIGIGNAAPQQKLHVGSVSVAGSQGMIRLSSNTTTGNGALRSWDVGVPQTGDDVSKGGYSFVINDATLNSDPSIAPQFLIKFGSGNVGIGTISPATKLDVAGTVRMTGLQLPTGAGAGKLLISDATGNATWGQATGSGSGWSLTGNAGTTAANFLGTTDSNPLVFKVKNFEMMRLGTSANISIGPGNTASALYATVGGGNQNTASGTGATVAGGVANIAAGAYSFAAGDGAQANHDGTFVWHSREATDFVSTDINQFLISASGGVGINTNNPAGNALNVNGTAKMTGFQLPTGAGASKVLSSDAAGGGTWNTLTSLLGAGSITNTMIQSVDWTKITNAPSIGNSWGVTGNAGTTAANFLGTTDSQPLVFKVNYSPMMRLGTAGNVSIGPGNTADGFYATVGGGNGNTAPFQGATVGGGQGNAASNQYAMVGGGLNNAASGEGSTVGGGAANKASGVGATVGGGGSNTASNQDATVGGGFGNTASGSYATVGGGSNNTAVYIGSTVGGGQNNTVSGQNAIVPGGLSNTANGNYSFAAGQQAQANHNGSFVWNDSTGSNTTVSFISTAADQFNIHASGGVRIFSNAAVTTGVLLAPGSGSWSSASDRNLKTNFQSVDTSDVLEKLTAMPLTTWNYKANPAIRHMGVMAQDFYAAFDGLGVDDKHIDTVDADGVAFAAIQGLNRKFETQIATLKGQMDGFKARNAILEAKLVEMDMLKAQLAALVANLAQMKAEKAVRK